MSRIEFHKPVNIINFTKEIKTKNSSNGETTKKTENFLTKHKDFIRKKDFSFLKNEDHFSEIKNYRRSVHDFHDFYDSIKEDMTIKENIPLLVECIRIHSYRLFLLFFEFLIKNNLQVYLKNSLFLKNFKNILEEEDQKERKKSQTSFIKNFWNKNITILISEEPEKPLDGIPDISSLKELNKYAQNSLKLSQTSWVNRQIKASFLREWTVEKTPFNSQSIKTVNEDKELINSSKLYRSNLSFQDLSSVRKPENSKTINIAYRDSQEVLTELLKKKNLPEKTKKLLKEMEEYQKTVREVIASDKSDKNSEFSNTIGIVYFINSRLKELRAVNNNEITLFWRRCLFHPLWGDPFDGTLWNNEKINKESLDWYKQVIIKEKIRDFFSKDTNPDRKDFWSYVAGKRAITELPVNLEDAKAFLLKINLKKSTSSGSYLYVLYVVEFKQMGRAYFYSGEKFDKIVGEIPDWENKNADFFKPIDSKGEKKHFLELSEAVLCTRRHAPQRATSKRWDFRWQEEFEYILKILKDLLCQNQNKLKTNEFEYIQKKLKEVGF